MPCVCMQSLRDVKDLKSGVESGNNPNSVSAGVGVSVGKDGGRTM